MSSLLPGLGEACEIELQAIAQWWSTRAVDKHNGGFYGQIDAEGQAQPDANKGVILNTRILWFFSALAKHSGNTRHRAMADRAFQYIDKYFFDKDYGGLFWELDAAGLVSNARKQTFAQAFGLYAYSAYYALTQNIRARHAAMQLFELIEEHARDPEHGGYLAAFSRNWQALDNMAIDDNDIDAPKTFDTELHVLEAYTSLFRVCPSDVVADAMWHGLATFDRFIIDKAHGRCKTHFSLDWQDRSRVQIYGHGYEAAWLIWDAVDALFEGKALNTQLKADWQQTVLTLIDSNLALADAKQHYIYDSQVLSTGEINRQSTWWIQAEALIALTLANDMSASENYVDAIQALWAYIYVEHIDTINGEWHAVANQRADKVCMWKGPYHNGRAMLEICQRLAKHN